jgi:hypothetical protein
MDRIAALRNAIYYPRMAVAARVALCLALTTATAGAVVPRPTPRIAADTLVALPSAGVKAPLRVQQRLVVRRVVPASYTRFIAAAGGTWDAAWDRATGVPTRIWGSGILVPGSIASPAIAELAARGVLADHLALLAPGASPSDFELVSNVYDGDVRAIGFVQRAGGLAVLGGQVSFRFKRDRLFVIGSEALPNVVAPAIAARLAPALLRDRVSTVLRARLAVPNATATSPAAEVVLPLVGDDTVLGYRIVAPVELDGGADGRYAAYVDPSSGEVIALHQRNSYASGTVLYHSVDRYPAHGYVDRPAPLAHVELDNTAATTASDGTVSWSPDVVQTVTTAVAGDLVAVANDAMNGTTAVAMLPLDPGGSLVWNTIGVDTDEAQVDAYIDTNLAKQYARTFLDPNLSHVDDQLPVKVNENNTCNAFFDGASLNFFAATPMPDGKCPAGTTCCENTARIQDVNFHEFGHFVHTHEIISGVGAFDGAMSEGAADFFACSITNDSGMGRGFFYSDAPLRDLNNTTKWPDDIGEIHHTGMIFGGSFWDLRVALIAQYGPDQGVAITNKIYVGTLRRATGIATALIEALVTDDDDGNLANGTPNECAILAAFGKHGLRVTGGFFEAPATLNDNALSIGVAIDVTGLSPRCPNVALAGATLAWHPSYTGMPERGTTNAQPAGPNRFWAELPLSIGESVFYQGQVGFADGTTMVLPDNVADPYYQLYQGPTTKLYCTDFETDPFADGWTQGADPGENDQWQWGAPSGQGCETCPPAAYSGTHVLAEVLDGNYPSAAYAWVKMPTIFIGQYSNVRLQYRRWLGVEDNHFDQARVTVNDLQAWENGTENIGGNSAYHHIDKEWRFHDVPLSPWFFGHSVTVGWDLRSDMNLSFAGWNLDDVCIVADVTQICGDGKKDVYEECDDGAANEDVPDKCRTYCKLPTCGDGIVDTNEQCDDGALGSKKCTAKCKIIPPAPGAGCCSADGGGGSIAMGGFAFAFLFVRRRRSSRRSVAA